MGPCARIGALAFALPLAVVATSCSQTANVTDVYTALDGDGARKRNEFFTDTKEIHCIAEAGIGRPGVTIEGLIRQTQRYDFEQSQLVEADRVVANVETSPEPGQTLQKIDLVLEKPGQQGDEVPYVPGRFVCEVRLDGELAGTATFNVLFPDCPTSAIAPGSFCLGFYEPNRQCPRFGATSNEEGTCSCTLTGWDCQ